MLVKFSVENYLSFNEKTTLSLKAEALREQFQDYNTISTPFKEISLLKSTALYGHNSGGKSNLLKAIGFFKDLVLNSFKEYQANETIPVEEFKFSRVLSDTKRNSFFEIEFIQYDVLYRYGFELNKNQIIKEWLNYRSKGIEKSYFLREGQTINLSSTFAEGFRGKELTRPNALFLSVLANLGGNISTMLIKWFQDLTYLSDTNYNYFIDYTADLLEKNPLMQNLLSKVFEAAGIGFSQVVISKQEIDESYYSFYPEEIKRMLSNKKYPPIIKIETVHKIYDDNGNYIRDQRMDFKRNESLGTQKFFALAGVIVYSLMEGKLMIVDELDARLHPNLTKEIISLFNSVKENKKGAQLIFSTHNTNILDQKILRRDQIYIVNKSESKSTIISTLYNNKLRNDSSYEKEILNPKYGGIKPKQLTIFPDDNF